MDSWHWKSTTNAGIFERLSRIFVPSSGPGRCEGVGAIEAPCGTLNDPI